MILLNEHLLPEGVTKSDLESADYEILNRFRVFSYPFPETHVVIELSSLTPKRRFGDLSLAKAKTIILRELKRLILANEENSELLSRLREAKDADVAKSVIEEIFHHYFDPADRDVLWPKMRELLSLLDKVYFYRLILGEYVYATHWISEKEKTIDDQRIILYVNNIKNCLKEGKTVGDGMKEVMAHEYFHMCHHYAGYIKNNYEFDERNDYLSSVVKESLATLYQRAPFHSHLERAWEGDVLINPYAGCRYLHGFLVQRHEKNMDNDKDVLTLMECLEVGMNKWLKMILNDPRLYYQILNKGVALYKKQKPARKKNGLKLKEGAVYGASSLEDLLRNRLGLNADRYRNEMFLELENGELALSIDERDLLTKCGEFELLDQDSILCRRSVRFAYLKTIHVFLSNFGGSKSLFEYEGPFELRCGDGGKRVLIRKGRRGRIHPFRIRLKENLLAALRNDEEVAFDPKSSFSFLIDSYKFPKVDANDNFLKCLEGILKEKGISKYRMCEICGLDRDNTKRYFDKNTYERKKGMNPDSDVPFVVPAKVAYKICLGLRLSPGEAEHLMSLAKQPNTKSGNLTGFVLECLKDKELLELDDSEYKETINGHLEYFGKDILFEW